MTGALGGSFALGPWRVHRAGYGAMHLAGDGAFGPPRDRDEALRVLRAAVAVGVDHIDPAQFYGSGTVNQLIREALHPYPDGLAIVSKVAARRDTDRALLRQGIEDNLATLGTRRLAAVNLRKRQPNVERGDRAPALTFMCVVGFLASAAAILIGFVPPSQFENGSSGAYVGLILAGTVLLGLLPPWLFLTLRKPSWKQTEPEASS